MRCRDIDAILDDHRIGALHAADRAAVDAHLEECRRCAGVWLVNHTLLGEALTCAPPGLLDAAVCYAEARTRAEPGHIATPWPRWAGFAALIAIGTLFVLVALPHAELAPAGAGAAASTLVEGRDYRTLPPAAGTSRRASNRVEVVQFFAYDCRRCYAFEQAWNEWTERNKDDITLVRVPVLWNDRAERYARAHYAAEALGKAAEVQPQIFEDIHTRGNRLESYAGLAELFARFGFDGAAFDGAYASLDVERAVNRARGLAERYGVTGVPSLVVGDELVTTAAMAGSPARLVEVVERLVRCVQERPAAEYGTRHC